MDETSLLHLAQSTECRPMMQQWRPEEYAIMGRIANIKEEEEEGGEGKNESKKNGGNRESIH